MKTILLVEDDKFLSSLLKNRLEKEGIMVVYAADGEAALNALKLQKVDLVLLDVILPKKNGFEVLEEIQNDPSLRESPVIIISNLGRKAIWREAKISEPSNITSRPRPRSTISF
jgi:DNA-binding response OmpR family regulator